MAIYSVKEGKNPARYTSRKPSRKLGRRIRRIKRIPSWA